MRAPPRERACAPASLKHSIKAKTPVVQLLAVPTDPARVAGAEERPDYRRDGRLLDRPFLDIRDRVRDEGEGGLLSIAFIDGLVRVYGTAGDDTLWRLLDGNTDSIIAIPAMAPELTPTVSTPSSQVGSR